MAVASAGPYASLHVAPDSQPRQRPMTQLFYRLDAFLPSLAVFIVVQNLVEIYAVVSIT